MSCFKHTMLCIDHAAKEWKDPEITFSVLLHDLSKPQCWKERGNLHGHEEANEPLVKEFCKKFKAPNHCRDLALIVAIYHGKVHSVFGRNGGWTRPKSIMKLLEQTNALAKPQRFEKFLKACESDAKGRGLPYHEKYEYTTEYFLTKPYPQREYLLECLNAAKSVDTKSISSKMVEEGKDGKLIGEQIRVARIDSIRKVQRLWKLKIENKLNSED